MDTETAVAQFAASEGGAAVLLRRVGCRVYGRGSNGRWQRGGAVPFGELRHHCATSGDALYIIGVWESADHIVRRWSSEEMRALLGSAGSPIEPTERTIVGLHTIEPPL